MFVIEYSVCYDLLRICYTGPLGRERPQILARWWLDQGDLDLR